MGIIQFGWHDLARSEALELGLEHAARLDYEAFMIGLFGFGLTVAVRPKVTQ